jgi:hypothetical protein
MPRNDPDVYQRAMAGKLRMYRIREVDVLDEEVVDLLTCIG